MLQQIVHWFHTQSMLHVTSSLNGTCYNKAWDMLRSGSWSVACCIIAHETTPESFILVLTSAMTSDSISSQATTNRRIDSASTWCESPTARFLDVIPCYMYGWNHHVIVGCFRRNKVDWLSPSILGLYSLSGKTSYGKISWRLEAARFGFGLFQSLWNLTGTSAAALPRCLSNFRALRLL